MQRKKEIKINKINSIFIQRCDDAGRVSIDDALKIADDVGLFNDDDLQDLILRAHKQMIRSIFRSHKLKGKRVMRSVKNDTNNEFVNLYDKDAVTEEDLNTIDNDEHRRISQSVKIITHNKHIRQWLHGQISLEEVFTYDELYGSLQ